MQDLWRITFLDSSLHWFHVIHAWICFVIIMSIHHSLKDSSIWGWTSGTTASWKFDTTMRLSWLMPTLVHYNMITLPCTFMYMYAADQSGCHSGTQVASLTCQITGVLDKWHDNWHSTLLPFYHSANVVDLIRIANIMFR